MQRLCLCSAALLRSLGVDSVGFVNLVFFPFSGRRGGNPGRELSLLL